MERGLNQCSSLFHKPYGVTAGDQYNQRGTGYFYRILGCLPKHSSDQITEWSLLRRKDTGAVDKHVTDNAGPQTAALPDNDGVEKANDDGITYL